MADPIADPKNAHENTAPRIVVAAAHKDTATGAEWVHKDLVRVQDAWAEEGHVGPPEADERFGDVNSWAEYVKTYGNIESFLTWNSEGLFGVLDYHAPDTSPGRCQWQASHPFHKSLEFRSWLELANGRAMPQKPAIEKLEDLSEDITDPTPAELMNLLRSLRTTVNKTAQAELRPDGTTSVSWTDDKGLAARGGTTDLPPSFSITIPLLKGHDVRYKLTVRLRATVDDQAHLTLRFTIPQAEQALEMVYANRVAEARTLLGDGFHLLRAAG